MMKLLKWLFLIPAWVLWMAFLYTNFILWGTTMAVLVVLFAFGLAFVTDEKKIQRVDLLLYDFAIAWESIFTDDIEDTAVARPFKPFPYDRYSRIFRKD